MYNSSVHPPQTSPSTEKKNVYESGYPIICYRMNSILIHLLNPQGWWVQLCQCIANDDIMMHLLRDVCIYDVSKRGNRLIQITGSHKNAHRRHVVHKSLGSKANVNPHQATRIHRHRLLFRTPPP